jgi:hypothetical protein
MSQKKRVKFRTLRAQPGSIVPLLLTHISDPGHLNLIRRQRYNEIITPINPDSISCDITTFNITSSQHFLEEVPRASHQ